MATVITYDEPDFIGQALTINGELTCVLPSTATTHPEHQALVRRLMRGAGVDCLACGGCPVGEAG
ncbi:hypothetical protein [Streptomyces sp. CC228A]|uniref:hypothetical protein n=1 Tax=Streptomyces sp. CC228A TaxID=2898186 RepID=UPI001F31D5E9|nr:hypothetical protein [Streptomyces sp. CC228A]